MNYLADVNVWLALVHGGHEHHAAARNWFGGLQSNQAWFCRLSQLGLLRLLSNTAVMGRGVKGPAEAWAVYDALLDDRRVAFVAEPLEVESELRRLTGGGVAGHKVWSDAYLAAVALCHGTTLVTFDKRLGSLGAPTVVL